MCEELKRLTTERRNGKALPLDTLRTLDIVKLMNEEDRKVAEEVGKELESIAQAIDLIAEALERGGRLFYFGAGTSGRLGILDASECPPTFGTDPSLVQGVIAGGMTALIHAVENAEDAAEEGAQDVIRYDVKRGDVLVGITASGRTPYIMGAMQEARKRGAETVALSCNEEAEINQLADVFISVVVGPEIVSGSTRLKAGTAQKLVLNMLSTVSMIRLGKVYGDLMVNVQATNFKLRERVKRIIIEATNVDYEQAEALMNAAGGDAKTAIVMYYRGIGLEEARLLLEQCGGKVRAVIEKEEAGYEIQ